MTNGIRHNPCLVNTDTTKHYVIAAVWDVISDVQRLVSPVSQIKKKKQNKLKLQLTSHSYKGLQKCSSNICRLHSNNQQESFPPFITCGYMWCCRWVTRWVTAATLSLFVLVDLWSCSVSGPSECTKEKLNYPCSLLACHHLQEGLDWHVPLAWSSPSLTRKLRFWNSRHSSILWLITQELGG